VQAKVTASHGATYFVGGKTLKTQQRTINPEFSREEIRA
jgi:hypothetical protein